MIEKKKDFDPNGPGQAGQLFGLPFTPEEANFVIVPVPWEVTVSYTDGTAGGPEAILEASAQVDLFDLDVKESYSLGLAMADAPEGMEEESRQLRETASDYIQYLMGHRKDTDAEARKARLKKINDKCAQMVSRVKEVTGHWLDQGKMVGLLGGDHSTPLGFMQALAEREGDFGILQIDAHADLREAYEDFTYSHASIIYNALEIKELKKVVQVGIRDLCDDEKAIIDNSKGRIKTFYDRHLSRRRYAGETWNTLCEEIISELPDRVYISFDIDGLDPKLCPNTGTPVAGGFEFEEVRWLIQKLAKSGKTIIGFDLVEVAPSEDEWDANVGARMLYSLVNLMAANRGKLEFADSNN